MNKSLYMIFIEKNKTNKIKNYVWFYDYQDKIMIVIGMNNNSEYKYEYIPKKDIFTVISDINFKRLYRINYINTDLMKKINIKNNLDNNLENN